jgi:chondroitin 4-sulfotransferase 11
MLIRISKCYIKLIKLTFFINAWMFLLLINVYQSTVENYEAIYSRNTGRLEKLHEKCHDLQQNNGDILKMPSNKLENLFVDQRHKLLYCYTPKVACTTWKQIFMVLTAKWNNTDFQSIPHDTAHEIKNFKKFSSLSLDDKKIVLANYTKFMIVRDPFERLISAYRNKIKSYKKIPPFFQSISRIIVNNRFLLEKYVPMKIEVPELLSKENPYDVEFHQFVQYLLMPNLAKLPNGTYNEHWRPMNELCHPCLINYSILARYETIEEDSNFALDSIGVFDLKFPEAKNSSTKNYISEYFSKIPSDIIQRLYSFYKLDFELFGYGVPDVVKKGS